MRADATISAPDGLVGDVTEPVGKGSGSRKKSPAGDRLERAVLAHLPLGVAVIDASQRRLFWNNQAGCMFGGQSLTAEKMPLLADVLADSTGFTVSQRDRIIAFAAGHIAAGDRTAPESLLRISLERDRRVVIRVSGIGYNRWMMVIDDGTMALTGGHRAGGHGAEDALLDPLTGLGNRRHFNQVLRDLVDHGPGDVPHAVVMIDLDRFKSINETLGHPVGDALLCLVARRLRHETRDEDMLVRLGGDEFVILVPSSERAEALATRVIEILSRPFLVEGHIANICASIGIARFPEHGASADDLMRHAELALYDAKSSGRAMWRMFQPVMASDARARRELEADLRKALTLGELALAYQAQFNVQQRTLTGFEALLRWHHPTRGIVPPTVFIPVAEDIGCIVALGEWVLKTACKEAARWPEPLTVAVNVSPKQFQESERLFNAVTMALKASGLAPTRLELEITESSLLVPEAGILGTLNRLRAIGVRIAMDDFGTGYSSLSQLRAFPFNKIKIDRSFVAGLGRDDGSAAMIRAITALGSSLGMTTIAEGVETEAQAAQIESDGCTDIQGYLISRPIPAGEIDALLRTYPDALHAKLSNPE